MNVLFLTQEYPPETGWGGIGTATFNLAHAMAQLGHRVHVLASAAPPASPIRTESDGVTIHRIRRAKLEIPILRRLLFSSFPWTKHQWEYIFSVSREIDGIIRAHAIQVLESPEIWAEGLLYSFRRRVPIIVKLHTPLFLIRELDKLPHTLDWRIVEFTDKIWTRRANTVVSASSSLAEIVAREYRLDNSRIPILPESVDANLFRPMAIDRNPTPRVLYVGRLEPRKGILTLADAIPHVLASCPDSRFTFVGSDMWIDGRSSKEMLVRRLHELGISEQVDFPGRLSSDGIRDFFQRSDVSVFPSNWENFAVACLEAMACGRPVVATNVGGFPEMIEPGVSGLLAPAGDPIALAKSIIQVLQNPPYAYALGFQARRRIQEKFASDVVARQTLDVYEDAIRSFSGRNGTT